MALLRRNRRGVVDVNAAFGESVRQLKSGEKRVLKVDWTADFLGADFTDRGIRAAVVPIATAIAEAFSREVKAITARASDATIARRESAAKNPSSKWVKRRYAGGRIGALPPDPHSIRLFNDSGRLTKVTVRARQTSGDEAVFTMNVPANRFKADEFPSQAAFDAMITRLKELVPIARGVFAGESARQILRAQDRAMSNLLQHVKDRQASLIRERNRLLFDNLKQVFGAVF